MWSPFSNLEIIWFSQTTGLYQCYLYFPNCWKGWYKIASSNLSMITNYCMIISSGFKEVNLPSLLLWCWLTKSLKLWITRNVSLVYSWIFQKHSTLLIMKFYYLNWRNMVYKEQSYSGEMITYLTEDSMWPTVIINHHLELLHVVCTGFYTWAFVVFNVYQWFVKYFLVLLLAIICWWHEYVSHW